MTTSQQKPNGRSIFTQEHNQEFSRYTVTIQMRDKLMAGIPQDPHMIEGWLRRNTGVTNKDEIREMMRRTLQELGVTPEQNASGEVMWTSLEEASKKLATEKTGCAFKKDANGLLYVESRWVKAMLKEAVNIRFGGRERWRPTGARKTSKGEELATTAKDPKSFIAERAFIFPDQISLNSKEPHGVHMQLTHIKNWRDEQVNSMSYHEYVSQVTLKFEVHVLMDDVANENWPKIWVNAQEIGLGAMRSQGYGRFDVTAWDKLS